MAAAAFYVWGAGGGYGAISVVVTASDTLTNGTAEAAS
jgi:hypothetical protein